MPNICLFGFLLGNNIKWTNIAYWTSWASCFIYSRKSICSISFTGERVTRNGCTLSNTKLNNSYFTIVILLLTTTSNQSLNPNPKNNLNESTPKFCTWFKTTKYSAKCSSKARINNTIIHNRFEELNWCQKLMWPVTTIHIRET